MKYAYILAPQIALETAREVQTIPENFKDEVKIAAREETSPSYCPQAQLEQRVGGSGSEINDGREYAQTIMPPAEPNTVNSNDAVN